jgi:hypothetical protein
MENEELMFSALVVDSAHLPAQPGPEVLPTETSTSSRGEVTARIIQACGLADSLAGSVCLHCANSVLAQDSRLRATLYCSALFRDLETCITDCTAFLPT